MRSQSSPLSSVNRVVARAGWMRALVAAVALAALILAGCGTPSGSNNPSSGQATQAPAATATPLPAVRYVAMGASDAVGVGATNPNTTAYVPIIISRLPKGASALNLGIDGETLHRALTDELPQVIQANPTLVTVWLVGNDFKTCVPLQQYAADLNTLLTQLREKTSAQVFVANGPDFSLLPAIQQMAASGSFCGGPGTTEAIRARAQQWNQVIDAQVAAHNDTLVNVFDANLAGNPDYISGDGFHPSDKGYLALANLFWAAITAKNAA